MLSAIISLSKRDDKFRCISSILLILSMILYFLPLLIIAQLPQHLEHSTLSYTVRNDDSLRLAYLCSICTSMPLIIDLLLDMISSSKNLNYNDRLQILLMTIIPGVIFLLFYQYHMFSYIIIGLFKLQYFLIIHITVSYIVEFAPQPLQPTPNIHLGLLFSYISANIQSISLLTNSQTVRNVFLILSCCFFGLSSINLVRMTTTWLKYIYKLHQSDMSDFKYHNECDLVSSYLIVLWLSLATALLENAFSSKGNLESFNEISCLLHIITFTIIAAILSVLPGNLVTNSFLYQY